MTSIVSGGASNQTKPKSDPGPMSAGGVRCSVKATSTGLFTVLVITTDGPPACQQIAHNGRHIHADVSGSHGVHNACDRATAVVLE